MDSDSLDNSNNNKTIIGKQPTLGSIANELASKNAFNEYTQRKSKNTLRAHRADLTLFSEFLIEYDGRLLESTGTGQWADLEPRFLANSLQYSTLHWAGITWGLLDLFKAYLLNGGRAIASINRALSTIKVYAKLAHKAGIITPEEYMLLKMVAGYSRKDKIRIDEKREITRIGHKKEEHTSITLEQARI